MGTNCSGLWGSQVSSELSFRTLIHYEDMKWERFSVSLCGFAMLQGMLPCLLGQFSSERIEMQPRLNPTVITEADAQL